MGIPYCSTLINGLHLGLDVGTKIWFCVNRTTKHSQIYSQENQDAILLEH